MKRKIFLFFLAFFTILTIATSATGQKSSCINCHTSEAILKSLVKAPTISGEGEG